jgi:hypothetical protein
MLAAHLIRLAFVGRQCGRDVRLSKSDAGNPARPHFWLNFRLFSKQGQQNTDCGAVPTHLKRATRSIYDHDRKKQRRQYFLPNVLPKYNSILGTSQATLQ